MKKTYDLTVLESKTDKELFLLGVQSNTDIKTICTAIFNRMVKAERKDVTPFLQEMARATVTKKIMKDESFILHQGYKKWEKTEYHEYYRFVNSRQARIRQLFPKETNTTPTTPVMSKADAVAKEQGKTKLAENRAKSWEKKAKKAQTNNKPIIAANRKLAAKLEKVEKENSELKKKINRLEREKVNVKSDYEKRFKSLANVKNMTEYRQVINAQ